MIEPGEGTLNYPATGQNGKALLLFRTEHDPQADAKALSDLVEQLATVATVHPDWAKFLAGAAQSRQ